MFVVYILFS